MNRVEDLADRITMLERRLARMRRLALAGLAALAVVAPFLMRASTVTIPHAFADGTLASATMVNANFTALKQAHDTNDGRLSALEAANASDAARLGALESKVGTPTAGNGYADFGNIRIAWGAGTSPNTTPTACSPGPSYCFAVALTFPAPFKAGTKPSVVTTLETDHHDAWSQSVNAVTNAGATVGFTGYRTTGIVNRRYSYVVVGEKP